MHCAKNRLTGLRLNPIDAAFQSHRNSIMKINSRALQQDLYQLMIDRESAHKISMSEENGEYRLI